MTYLEIVADNGLLHAVRRTATKSGARLLRDRLSMFMTQFVIEISI